MGYLSNSGVFLIHTLFGLYILVIMLRFLLQCVRADFYNPFSQFLVKATNPPLLPLRRIVPGFLGVDMAAVVLAYLLTIAEIALTSTLGHGVIPAITGLSIMAFADLLSLTINIFLFAILIQVVLSWVSPQTNNPITGLLYSLTEPIMGRARRIIPPISGLDLSPIVAIIFLQLLKMLVVMPISDIGRSLS